MDTENQNSCQDERTHVPPADRYPHYYHPLGRIVPNRIFVGGINFRVSESELRRIFSHFGAIKDVNIVTHRTGTSKGYGFVTFESQEDALRILSNANGICFKDKKLSIGQAFHKQQHHTSGQMRSSSLASPEPIRSRQVSHGTVYHTTSKGFPYIFHNGVAYFHCPTVSPPQTNWPSTDPLMLHQSHQLQTPYPQTACQHYQNPWNIVQPELPSATLMYPYQSEYRYQPADEVSLQYPIMEETPAEIPAAPVLYPGPPQFAPQHEPEKSFFPPSFLHRKAKCRRVFHHKNHYFLHDSPERPHASIFHSF